MIDFIFHAEVSDTRSRRTSDITTLRYERKRIRRRRRRFETELGQNVRFNRNIAK